LLSAAAAKMKQQQLSASPKHKICNIMAQSCGMHAHDSIKDKATSNMLVSKFGHCLVGLHVVHLTNILIGTVTHVKSAGKHGIPNQPFFPWM
jgi:hypothetical protein